MRTRVVLPLLACVSLGTAAGAAAADKGEIGIPCEPSRSCAIEMARGAGRENYRLRKDNADYLMALLAIAEMERLGGDKRGFAATLKEIRAGIEGYEGGRDEVGFRSSLAGAQADAGLIEEALATARTARGAKARGDALGRISRSLANQGQWRQALAIEKKVPRDKDAYSAEDVVMLTLIRTGRREWVSDSAAALAPGREAEAMARVELHAGHHEAARTEAARITDPDRRLIVLEEIGSHVNRLELYDELAMTARLIPPDAAKAKDADFGRIHFQIAAEWLIEAGAFDEALALLPKVGGERKSLMVRIAVGQALAGNYLKSVQLLESIEPDYRDSVLTAIAVGKVLAGDARLELALASIRARDERMDALKTIGERLPDARNEEAREALRQASALIPGSISHGEHIRLGSLASLQARRGFLDDALITASKVRNSEELLGAYGDIGREQMKRGLADDARRTFVVAEAQARRFGFNGEAFGQLVSGMADAGLLAEAYEQIKTVNLRNEGEYILHLDFEALIQGQIKAGQLRRAFEIAVLLSAHADSDPKYFLCIAQELKP